MRRFLPYLLLGTLAWGIGTLSYSFGLFSGVEQFLEDRLFTDRDRDARIVIVAIDDVSIHEIGQWPWPRAAYAQFFNNLAKARPRAAAFDVMLSEPSRLGAADDQALATALRAASYPIVFPIEAVNPDVAEGNATSAVEVKPLAAFLANPKIVIGGVNLVLDADGVARRFPRSFSIPWGTTAHFAEVATLASGLTTPDVFRHPIERIVYAGGPQSFPRVSFADVWRGEHLSALEGKIVFIGSTAADLHDEAPTPTSRGALMPGVEIHATIANQLLKGYSLAPLSPKAMMLWMAVSILLIVLSFAYFSRVAMPLVLGFFVTLVSVMAAALLFDEGIVVNILHAGMAPLTATALSVVYRTRIGEKKRREIEGIFGKYVSKDVLSEILKDPNRVELGGEEKHVTVLFSDIRSFTTLSESMPAAELFAILNRYFSAMTEEILKNGGVVDKFIGDAIMAFWGAPLSDEHSADKAIHAAQGMLTRLELLNQEFKQEGKQEIKIGIGLYTGPAIAGNVGSQERFNYTVIGDTVNVASRLEGITKELKVPLIVGESTKQAATEPWQFETKGEVSVKGRHEPVRVYAVR